MQCRHTIVGTKERAFRAFEPKKAINNEKIHPNRFYLDLGVSDSESSRPGEGATPLYDYTVVIRQLSRT
jgi:hypothetical protein